VGARQPGSGNDGQAVVLQSASSAAVPVRQRAETRLKIFSPASGPTPTTRLQHHTPALYEVGDVQVDIYRFAFLKLISLTDRFTRLDPQIKNFCLSFLFLKKTAHDTLVCRTRERQTGRQVCVLLECDMLGAAAGTAAVSLCSPASASALQPTELSPPPPPPCSEGERGGRLTNLGRVIVFQR